MLPTVLCARDKWLKPGGKIFPDEANLYVACIEDGDYKEEKIEYWTNVYGFNFSCIQNMAYREPLVDIVNADSVVSSPSKVLTLNLNTCKVEDLTFLSNFSCKIQRNDYVHAFIAWFDISFSCCHKPIYFSTSPSSKYTHWKQTVFYLKETLTVNAGDVISGNLKVSPNSKNERDIDIEIHVDFDGKYQSLHTSQQYILR